MRAFLIDLPGACFGIEVEAGRVVNAPPIARWMIGRNGHVVRSYVSSRRGTITEMLVRPGCAGEEPEDADAVE